MHLPTSDATLRTVDTAESCFWNIRDLITLSPTNKVTDLEWEEVVASCGTDQAKLEEMMRFKEEMPTLYRKATTAKLNPVEFRGILSPFDCRRAVEQKNEAEGAFSPRLINAEEQNAAEGDCDICLCPLSDGQVCVTNCSHYLHHDCLLAWHKSPSPNHHLCPLCRKAFNYQASSDSNSQHVVLVCNQEGIAFEILPL